MSNLLNTFSRLVNLKQRWALGERAHRITSVIAGLLNDAISDGARQVFRWTLPLPDTPVDALPYLLRDFGLPSYVEGYFATLARLRTAFATHAIAGSEAQLISEAVIAGLTGAGIELDTDSSFWFTYPDAGDELEYGDSGPLTCDYDEENGIPPNGYAPIYGVQLTDDIAHNLRRLIAYFKPARERWNGVKPPST